ncbi:hypothetical protein ACE193_01025 [Bernardetia sp. OM2101]|uniref:hypothetical protein n=1 Tax=Bernardetia sp. OM2101 TaxID=3344876 RepID=UPI0035CF0DC6
MKSNSFFEKKIQKNYSIHSVKLSLFALWICVFVVSTSCQNDSSNSETNDSSITNSINEDIENNSSTTSTSQSNTVRPDLDNQNNERDNLLAEDYAANSESNSDSDNSSSFTKQDSLEFFKRFSPKTQTFVIDSDKDQHIFGEKGTHILIEKKSFVFEDGTPVKSKVNVELKEFYDKKTILLAGLATQTRNGFLESGGMIHVQATAEGKKVKLKKEITIEMPTLNTKVSSQEEMKVYFASNNSNSSLDRNSTLNPPTNWQTNGTFIDMEVPEPDYMKWKYLGKKIHKNYVRADTVCQCADVSLVYEKIEPLSKAIEYKEDFTHKKKQSVFPKAQKSIDKLKKRNQRFFPLEGSKNIRVVGNATQLVYDFYPLSEEDIYSYDTIRVAFEIDEFRTGTVVERMESTHNAVKKYTTQTSIRPNSGVFLTVELLEKGICKQSKKRFFLQSLNAASKVLPEAEKSKNEWKRIQNGTQENYDLSYDKRDKAIMVWTGIVRTTKAKYNNENYYEGEGRTYQKYIDEELKKEFENKNVNYAKWIDNQAKNNPNFDESKITSYVLKTKQMGWINCDRFYGIPEERKTDLIVKTQTTTTLIFNRINAVMKSNYHSKGVQFAKIPKGEKITLFSVQKKEGKLFMALHETTIGNEPISLVYEEVSFQEMQDKLDYL